MTTTMAEHLEKLQAGEIGFERFAAATAVDWEHLSRWLMRWWRLPPAIEVEDVKQEMLLACWRSVPQWREDGGQPLKKWVIYRSVAAAKDWLNRQRNSYKRRSKTPGRYPRSFSELSEREAAVVDFWDYWRPTQEVDVIRRQEVDRTLARCQTDREHYVVVAVIEAMGDIDGAVDWLYSDVNIRRRCRFGSRTDARRAIWRTTSKVTNA